MKARLILVLYRALLPLLFIAAFPGWILKMLKRGGFQTALNERLAIYFSEKEFEPSHAVHLHSISVGETILALKLLRTWKVKYPQTRFVLATGTSTGHDLATSAKIPDLRVTYSPLDFPCMVRRYLDRFEPSQIVILEGDIWPNLLLATGKRHIPVSLANARVSPRSAKRYLKFAPAIRPFFSKLSSVCIQATEHKPLWQSLGIPPQHIHFTGSIKFDPQSATPPPLNPAFASILNKFGENRPIILAASTFQGEETLITQSIFAAHPDALPIIVPRHAERRDEVTSSLLAAGFHPVLRSKSLPTTLPPNSVLVIDTTGELATWTSHADVVIIGKSFLAIGGQNPAEAIIARKPLILGPHMENFQPLVANLHAAQGALQASTPAEITAAIRAALTPETTASLTENAFKILSTHQGATLRHLEVLHTACQTA